MKILLFSDKIIFLKYIIIHINKYILKGEQNTTIINDTSVVVFTSEELKTVLEQNNNYTQIYFGANITLTSGINIANTKYINTKLKCINRI